ncbi:MAG TPA: YtcA family lipoprotein [Terriglobales bacterium]|nr:YtcA family lipoprotein [Terriglobales bacterium]
MFVRQFGKTWLLCLAVIGCTGCSRAPSIEIIGSFFPAWMFCIMAALILTGLIRLALVRWEMEQKLAPLIVFYPSLAVAISCSLWFILFA